VSAGCGAEFPAFMNTHPRPVRQPRQPAPRAFSMNRRTLFRSFWPAAIPPLGHVPANGRTAATGLGHFFGVSPPARTSGTAGRQRLAGPRATRPVPPARPRGEPSTSTSAGNAPTPAGGQERSIPARSSPAALDAGNVAGREGNRRFPRLAAVDLWNVQQPERLARPAILGNDQQRNRPPRPADEGRQSAHDVRSTGQRTPRGEHRGVESDGVFPASNRRRRGLPRR